MNEGVTPESVMEIGAAFREQILATTSVQERQRILATVPLQERLAGLAPKERLEGLAPKERLEGLAPEEMAALLREIEAMLGKQATKDKPTRLRTRKKK